MFAHKHLKPSTGRRKSNGPRWVRRWHRRLGIWSALAVALLSLTGIMLNHIDRLYASGDFVSSEWLLDWYDVGYPQRVVTNQHDQRETNSGNEFIWADGTIIHNGRALFFNQSSLTGLYTYQNIEHLFTQTDLHLFSANGEFIETVPLSDLGPIKRADLTTQAEIIAIATDAEVWVINLNSLNVEPLTDTSTTLTTNLVSNLTTHSPDSATHQLARKQMLLKSKVLLDLHSGRFFGKPGPLIIDLFAVCFLLLAITGITAWVRQARRERKVK